MRVAEDTFAALQTDVFARQCALGPCHSVGVAAGGLVLEGPGAYEALVGAVPENFTAREAGWLRVTPGAPERSFLWAKLVGPGPGQGSRMPLGAAPLAPEQLARIEAWILAGAPRGDEPPLLVTPSPSPTATPVATDPTPAAVSFARLQAEVFVPRCAVAFCHDGTSRAGNLDLTQPYESLVGVPPANSAARDAGWMRVDPGRPERSFLLTKITLATFDTRWGSPMPLSGPKLEAAWVEAIAAWISRGAPRDGQE